MRHFQSSTQAERVQRSYGFFFCMSGPNSAKAAAAYARSRERKIEDGDLVMIHANTCADGYWTDITRTYTAGAPTDRQDAMRGAIREARNAALDAIRPGALARDIDGTARSVMAAHGFGDAFKHSTGHGVGFAAANGNALPRIHPQSTDVLQVGMTFNIEPAAYFDGYGGMRHCDVVAVTSDGVEVLTEF
jgi:Xaa-Pro aminopeptidase